MSDLNPDSKHVKDPENECSSERRKEHHHSRPKRSFNKRTIILLLIVLIILLIGSFLIFRSPSPRYNDDFQATDEMISMKGMSSGNMDYKSINGKSISINTTETDIPAKKYQERIEIPGDIADKMATSSAKPIEQVQPVDGQFNTGMAKLEQKSTRTYVSRPEEGKPAVKVTQTTTRVQKKLKYKELPLTQTIENNHYTIQLSGATTKKNLLKYAKEHNLSNYQIYQTSRKDDTWYVIIKGDYPTMADAKSALNSLPNKMKAEKPWIRSGKSVRKDRR